MVPKWSKIGPKSVPNRVQIGPKIGCDGLWIQVGRPDYNKDQFPPQNFGHLEAKIGPNLVQNRFWSDLKSDFKTNTFSRLIFDRFLVDFEAVGTTFLIDVHSSSMQSYHYMEHKRILQKCTKSQFVFSHFWISRMIHIHSHDVQNLVGKSDVSCFVGMLI